MRTGSVELIYFAAAVWVLLISIQGIGNWIVSGTEKYQSEQRSLSWKDKK